MSLVEITPETHGVDIDLVYATPNNLTGKPIYAVARCYLHADAERQLLQAVSLAAAVGCRLKLYDAFRPAEAQWVLWRHLPDPIYIADPRIGSSHSMGVAVDLTLIDSASGQELPMGTDFDDMRPLSWHGNTEVCCEAQRNRYLLLGIMSAAGFDFYRNEWWHYELLEARLRYPVRSDSTLKHGLMSAHPTLFDAARLVER